MLIPRSSIKGPADGPSGASPAGLRVGSASPASPPRFDPRSDSFWREFSKSASLQSLNLRLLTPYQRALLVLDGTVTSFIESWTMDPIDIICLGQTLRKLPSDHLELAAPARTPVIARSVILEGRYTRRFHAHAVSLIVPGRLPEKLRLALEMGSAGIGQILGANALETRREILWSGREQIENLPPEVQQRWSGEFIVRTYRIHADGKPIMVISERFPFAKVESPAYD